MPETHNVPIVLSTGKCLLQVGNRSLLKNQELSASLIIKDYGT